MHGSESSWTNDVSVLLWSIICIRRIGDLYLDLNLINSLLLVVTGSCCRWGLYVCTQMFLLIYYLGQTQGRKCREARPYLLTLWPVCPAGWWLWVVCLTGMFLDFPFHDWALNSRKCRVSFFFFFVVFPFFSVAWAHLILSPPHIIHTIALLNPLLTGT